MKTRTSLFITFEGGEGSGKSYQARALHRRLERLAIPSLLTREPGGTPLGDRISRLVKRSRGIAISPASELLLFNASRAQLVADVILSALKDGKVVVCDRFTDSTVAYQGYGRGLDMKQVTAANTMATARLKPDLTVLLDIAARDGLARKRHSESDRFERELSVFHERVRRGYLALAKQDPERFFVVDGRQDRQTIAASIWNRVSPMLARKSSTGRRRG